MDRREAKDMLSGYRLLLAEETDLRHALDLAIEALQKVSVYEQVKWERDRALETLDEHGIGLGQIAEETSTTTDCISRQQAVEAVANIIWHFLALATDALAGLPPVTPTEHKEHGRLIDADALIEYAEKEEEQGVTFCIDSAEDLRWLLEDNAPTIVPATPTDMRGDTE